MANINPEGTRQPPYFDRKPLISTYFLFFALPLIMVGVKRRFHVRELRTGFLDLDIAEAHHARDVLRLNEGVVLELFDDAGRTATGPLVMVNPSVVRVQIVSVDAPAVEGLELTVAAAVPKGDRADWMIEKLCELGVDRFVPIAAERSVVLPGGRNKIERWGRIALEAAKQSRRAGNMKISELTPLAGAVKPGQPCWYLSTVPDAMPIGREVAGMTGLKSLTLLIGPEGGWSDDELKFFIDTGVTAVALTRTILRVETAAIAAAVVVRCHLS